MTTTLKFKVNEFGITERQLDGLAISLRRNGYSAHIETDGGDSYLHTSATAAEVTLLFGASYWMAACQS